MEVISTDVETPLYHTERCPWLNTVSDELIIRLGSFKKHLLLPGHLVGAKKLKSE